MIPRPAKWVPVLYQRDSAECATTCLAMILCAHGFPNVQGLLRERGQVSARGTDLATLARLARELGLSADGYRIAREALPAVPTPFIAHLDGNHFVVVTAVAPDSVMVHDPAYGSDVLTVEHFWQRASGIVLSVAPLNSADTRTLLAQELALQRTRRRRLWNEFYAPATRTIRRALAATIVLTIMLQVFSLAFPLSTQWLVDAMIQQRPRDHIVMIAFVLAGAGVVQLTLKIGRAHV